MTDLEKAEAATGIDSEVATLAAHWAPRVEAAIADAAPITRIGSCPTCRVVVAGTHLGERCPSGHRWAVRSKAELMADPALLRAAAAFALPEDTERERASDSARARFERKT